MVGPAAPIGGRVRFRAQAQCYGKRRPRANPGSRTPPEAGVRRSARGLGGAGVFATSWQNTAVGDSTHEPVRSRLDETLGIEAPRECAGFGARPFAGISSAVSPPASSLPLLALAFGVASGAGRGGWALRCDRAGSVAALLGGTRMQISGPTGPMTVSVRLRARGGGRRPSPWRWRRCWWAGWCRSELGIAAHRRAGALHPHPVVSGHERRRRDHRAAAERAAARRDAGRPAAGRGAGAAGVLANVNGEACCPPARTPPADRVPHPHGGELIVPAPWRRFWRR